MTLEERVKNVAGFGFTERQAGFLVLVMQRGGLPPPPVLRVRGPGGRSEDAGLLRGSGGHTLCHALRLRALQGAGVSRAPASPLSRHWATRFALRETLHAGASGRTVDDPRSRAREPGHDLVGHGAGEARALQRHDPGSRQEVPSATLGEEPKTTVRYFVDRLPIGVAADGRTHVFLYLGRTRARRIPPVSAPARHAAAHRAGLDDSAPGAAPSQRCHDDLSAGVSRRTGEPPFGQRRGRTAVVFPPPPLWKWRGRRPDAAGAAGLRAPRFRALYRTWRRSGEAAEMAGVQRLGRDRNASAPRTSPTRMRSGR
jgi:hypothetical protein